MADQKNVMVRAGGFQVIETEGDIFDAPEGSTLIHAVNCQGLWGSGIAEAFKRKYPAAFEVYKLHCKEKSKLPGTCLLIPPQLEDHGSSLPADKDGAPRTKRRRLATKPPNKKHWVCCLFTSYSYGKPTKLKAGKDSPERILSNTRAALEDLRVQVEKLDAERADLEPKNMAGVEGVTGEISDKGPNRDRPADKDTHTAEEGLRVNLGPLRACKFNSGSFGVDWKDTRALIEEAFDGSARTMLVISPPSKGSWLGMGAKLSCERSIVESSFHS